ncbi:peptidoglycan DD-metalloendopeptidase family protein [Fervidibacillus halotolerans]|uniref:Peptidoglycan DD-metalloendopeptidase family protein n=1 Tax=Fervidibacillus halotolerans TaxID=2980027 RepID=A0A9E8LZI2_9BACI|nr:M23 family metallopeptidase [Fervidibacillus halotolerans]WAA12277.1 peptidoglycan DD-metalloendopeptidase family protein [Fervidibacillus halotolerans]
MNLQFKENLSKMTERMEKFRIQTNGALKKTVIATLVVSTISINTAFADTKTPTKLQTIYHVYIDNEYIGAVSDKQQVENLLNAKMAEVKEQYKDYDLSFKADELVFVPEQIFRSTNISDEEVLKEVEEEYEVIVEAVALKINGETVTYLENQEKVEELINELKLKYVKGKDLEKLASGEELPELEEEGTRILDVKLSQNITVALDDVKPEQVLPVDDALKLLMKGTLEEKKYTVKEGDVLGSIAQDHGLKLKQLLELNPQVSEETILQIGDKLNVTAYEPYIDVIVEKEVLKNEKIDYDVEYVKDDRMYKGDTKVVQKGKEGEKAVKYYVQLVNGKEVRKEVQEEKVLKEPVTKVVHKGTKVVPSRGTGTLAWPTNGGYISSYVGYRWGSFHKGIDIARPSNYTIKAADNGTVVFAGWDGGYGNKIVIDHNNGMRTVYAHLSSISVSVGQTVEKGRKIGVMGSTGYSTGTHLHFEVYKNGVLQNPLSYLK